jgi:DNA-binding MarR family transcriptional regulator
MPEEVNWLNEAEQRAWRAQIRTFMMLYRQLERDLQPFGLAHSDYEILVVLSDEPERRLRMTELADATSQSRSKLSHQITRMERRGLVTREASEGDKRGIFAVLTPEGFAAIERAAPSHVEAVRRHFLDFLSPEQLKLLAEAYEPVYDYLLNIRVRD